MSCVLDTNVLIYFLNDALPPPALARVDLALRTGARHSVVTRMEILGWRGHTTESRLRAKTLLDKLDEIALTADVVDRVIELRTHWPIKLPDAIIAASALSAGFPLMTHNTEDFRRLAELTLIDPLAR